MHGRVDGQPIGKKKGQNPCFPSKPHRNPIEAPSKPHRNITRTTRPPHAPGRLDSGRGAGAGHRRLAELVQLSRDPQQAGAAAWAQWRKRARQDVSEGIRDGRDCRSRATHRANMLNALALAFFASDLVVLTLPFDVACDIVLYRTHGRKKRSQPAGWPGGADPSVGSKPQLLAAAGGAAGSKESLIIPEPPSRKKYA